MVKNRHRGELNDKKLVKVTVTPEGCRYEFPEETKTSCARAKALLYVFACYKPGDNNANFNQLSVSKLKDQFVSDRYFNSMEYEKQ